MSLGAILIILLVLFCLFGLPQVGTRVGVAHTYGYWPSGLGTVLIVVLLVLVLTGRL